MILYCHDEKIMASKIASEPLIYDFYSLISFSFKDDEMSFFVFSVECIRLTQEKVLNTE